MSPRELRLRERIDRLMDENEALSEQVAAVRKLNERNSKRLSNMRKSRNMWRRRCSDYCHAAYREQRRGRYARAA